MAASDMASGMKALFRTTAVRLSALYLLLSLRYGQRAGPNPWGSRGFEWDTPSPPTTHNFEGPRRIDRDPYAYDQPGR